MPKIEIASTLVLTDITQIFTQILRCGLSSNISRGLLGAHWLRSCKNSEVKRAGGWSNPRMGDHPGKLLVSSQKQNRAGSEGRPKWTISCYGGAGPGCDNTYLAAAMNTSPKIS
ncbi:hypothetical protein L3X38_025402 [Prunus dulcis]|uniref:Uncharacterized protein n=1 Tax=Prunus dulcis TaxID=3755 RepID=A0AAD4W394_PRUDU|nr:hypothetical protein L3X38_025402 [Prunus dulcis]